MGYSTERREVDCPSCGTKNYVVVFYAGDYRANERESTNCYECGAKVASEKCGWIHSAASFEEADLNAKQLPRAHPGPNEVPSCCRNSWVFDFEPYPSRGSALAAEPTEDASAQPDDGPGHKNEAPDPMLPSELDYRRRMEAVLLRPRGIRLERTVERPL